MNQIRKYLFLILLPVCFSAAATHAQVPSEAIRFDHLTDADGLSQRTVEAIIQDSHGYLWFGTYDGVNRYNGHEITVYKFDPNLPNSISFNEISAIIEDKEQNLWIATDGGGLNRYVRELDHFVHYSADPSKPDSLRLSDNAIYALAEDADGGIWIGTEYGLNYMDPETETFTHYYADSDDPNRFSENSVRALLTEDDGTLWVGTLNGFHRLNRQTGEFRSFYSTSGEGSISDNTIQVIYRDRRGTLWIGTQNGGLNYYDEDEDRFYAYQHDRSDPNSISDNSITNILEDSRGILWIGTENAGLNVFDRENNRFIHYKNEPGDPSNLNNNAIYSIYESRDQILWIGTYNGGLNITDRKFAMFEHYSHDPYQPTSLNTHSVFSFFEDSAGNFWVGTDGGGLNRFDRKTRTFTAYRHDPYDLNSLPNDVVFDIEEDQHGNLWIGTYRGGLSKFDTKTESFTHFRHNPDNPDGLNNENIFALYFDPENPNHLWIGTNGGGINLFDIENDQFYHFTQHEENPQASSSNYIREFYDDSRENFWVGAYGNNLIRFSKSDHTFHNYELSGLSFLSNAIQSIYEDSENRLWLGSRSGGLILFDRESEEFTSFTTREGLPSNIIYGILEDESRNLWLSTNNGIAKFNPETGSSVNYGVEHNLQSREFNQRAFYKDSSGYMYFGGVNGFNRFHPDSVRHDEHVSPVVLTDFLIFNEPVPIGRDNSPLTKHISLTDSIELSYDQSVFTIEYVTLNFDAGKGEQFAYMLEGFDSDWNRVGDKRSATYTNLNPGEYTFRVRAANSSGMWGDEVSLGIVITPPFWRTAWFYMLMILLIGSTGTYGFRWKVRSISEQNRRLEDEVARQTHDLKNTLGELRDTQAELVEKAHKAGMADIATNVLHNIGNILNSVTTSTSLISDILDKSSVEKLHNANMLLAANQENIEEFIVNDPKGKKLLEYYLKLDKPITKEFEQLSKQNSRLKEKIQLISDVVAAQQNYSRAKRLAEPHSPRQLIEDSIALMDNNFQRSDLIFERDYQPTDPIRIDKSKMIHVIINLLKNAGESIREADPDRKVITIQLRQDEDSIRMVISDTGGGISHDNLLKIFNHGFSTKSTGHGYGLHSCANYMKEMGGSIHAESSGNGKGASFILTFPRTVSAESE
ncbi:GHKL domain-containing protein [Rhodohalobacter sp. SW132]|uniref:sensor histidine kinase n=1 Tax=Rhodohalobacter sp. SW132 TaxID=2293433 RepID=UPI000E25E544|nr:sensor histidine kinase [Rhodohalobacter sp. SW132]REL33737.1 GHKL domain-containing protein [Rhodohalobacter sp. SW132]